MRRRKLLDGGRIVTISSNTADRIGSAGSSVYAMTKAVLRSLFAAPHSTSRRQITVKNIQPGPIETDMTADLMDYIGPKLRLGRIGKADEIADLAAWLTDAAAGYMTGASLTIAGRRTS